MTASLCAALADWPCWSPVEADRSSSGRVEGGTNSRNASGARGRYCFSGLLRPCRLAMTADAVWEIRRCTAVRSGTSRGMDVGPDALLAFRVSRSLGKEAARNPADDGSFLLISYTPPRASSPGSRTTRRNRVGSTVPGQRQAYRNREKMLLPTAMTAPRHRRLCSPRLLVAVHSRQVTPFLRRCRRVEPAISIKCRGEDKRRRGFLPSRH